MFVDLSNILRAAGFAPAPLELLRPDNNRTWIGLLQHKGELLAGVSGIRNADFKLAYLKHFAFLQQMMGIEEAPALVVTPEYSTPWAVVEAILYENVIPRVGAVWLLGCESIAVKDLEELAERHPDVHWHIGTQHLGSPQDGYVDPLIWMIRGNDQSGIDRLAIGVQLKCHAMGGDQDLIERDNLLLGQAPYFFRNLNGNEPSIRLAAIVCADALQFNHLVDLPDYAHSPYMIVHPQCTTNAYHPLLTRYRNDVYGQNEGDRYAFLSLNWAAGSSVNGVEHDFAGSIVRYRPARDKKSKEPRQGDAILNELHGTGIYIRFSLARTRTSPQVTTYFLNSSEHVYLLRCAKFDQVLATGTVDKEGVTKGAALQWDAAAEQWNPVAIVDDRVADQISRLGCTSVAALLVNPCARERLIAFSIGELECVDEWHAPWKFRSYRVSGDDLFSGTLARIRNEQEPQLTNMLERYRTLTSYLVPNRLSDCSQFSGVNPGSVSLVLSRDPRPDATFNSNIAIDGREGQGVVMYIGETAEWVARKRLEGIQGVLKPNRAAVWYMHAGDFHVLEMPQKTINAPEADPRLISAEKKQ